jgi:hypothetical protein
MLERFTASRPSHTDRLHAGSPIRFAPRFGMWVTSLFSLPGTIAHELALVCSTARARSLRFKHHSKGAPGRLLGTGISQYSPASHSTYRQLLPLGIWYAVAHSEASGGGICIFGG